MRATDFGRWWILPILGLFTMGAAPPEQAATAKKPASQDIYLTLTSGPSPDGTTPLHRAALTDDLTAVEQLIRGGADVKAATRYGVTPLALAAINGNAAILERLLKAGADPNTAQPGGETALMTAARTGQADAVKVLLAHGADVNAVENTRGQTALMWAAEEGNTDAVRALIAGGANLQATSRGPGASDKVELFSSAGQRRGGKDRLDVLTPFLFAVRAGHIDTVEALLQAGASPNETLENGTSALTLAVVNAHWELAAFLLEKGADPNAAKQGWTALHQLIRTRNPNIGQTPGAPSTGRLSSIGLAKKLIAHGGDVNARMTKDLNDGIRTRLVWIGTTPLLMASKAADVEMMRLLAANGADPKLTNAGGSTPLMLAAGLSMYHVSEDSGTDEAALEAVKVALEIGGGDLNQTDEEGDTALHGAAQRSAADITQLLIDRGARLDVKNKLGATPLMLANGFSVINAQRQPPVIDLLVKEMTARGLEPSHWPEGQPSAHRLEFEADPDTTESLAKRNQNSAAGAAAPAKPEKPQQEKQQQD